MTERKMIYLDDALEAIRKLPNAGIHWFVSAEAVFNALLKLPSVQPEQRRIPCGKCIHADGKHRRCKILDRTINEDYFCYWAEPYREEGGE